MYVNLVGCLVAMSVHSPPLISGPDLPVDYGGVANAAIHATADAATIALINYTLGVYDDPGMFEGGDSFDIDWGNGGPRLKFNHACSDGSERQYDVEVDTFDFIPSTGPNGNRKDAWGVASHNGNAVAFGSMLWLPKSQAETWAEFDARRDAAVLSTLVHEAAHVVFQQNLIDEGKLHCQECFADNGSEAGGAQQSLPCSEMYAHATAATMLCNLAHEKDGAGNFKVAGQTQRDGLVDRANAEVKACEQQAVQCAKSEAFFDDPSSPCPGCTSIPRPCDAPQAV